MPFMFSRVFHLTCYDFVIFSFSKSKVFLRYHHVDNLSDEIEKMEKKVIHMQRGRIIYFSSGIISMYRK